MRGLAGRIRTKANMEPFQDSALLHSGTPALQTKPDIWGVLAKR